MRPVSRRRSPRPRFPLYCKRHCQAMSSQDQTSQVSVQTADTNLSTHDDRCAAIAAPRDILEIKKEYADARFEQLHHPSSTSFSRISPTLVVTANHKPTAPSTSTYNKPTHRGFATKKQARRIGNDYAGRLVSSRIDHRSARVPSKSTVTDIEL